ncbi:HAD family hydrolase [Thermodesulfobacteriota bacterium]
MLIKIPGNKDLQLEHLVLDFNGTLACDGRLIQGVRERLKAMADQIKIHVLTADTFGGVASEVQGIPCEVSIIARENQEKRKLAYVEELGLEVSVSIGNGRNDRLMLKASALGIAVIQEEGTALEALHSADVVCTGIVSALDLLTNPLRLAATLRS